MALVSFKCHRLRSNGCNAVLSFKNGDYTLIGDHAEYHHSEETYIANLKHVNCVKERCIQEPIAIKDIFDQQTSK